MYAAIARVDLAILPIYPAQMQNTNWDDLRYIIALHRSTSYSAAARLLGVNSTTVARRLAAMEQQLGKVVLRSNEGEPTLTTLGQQLLQVALDTQESLRQLQDQATDASEQVVGEISISSTPAICHRVLMPHIPSFCEKHPALSIQLWSNNDNLDLRTQELDIALRLGRPERGGHLIKARRLGSMSHAIYIARKTQETDPSKIPWISYSHHLRHLAHAQWIESKIQDNNRRSALKVLDLDGASEAVAQGMGQTILPCLIGDADRRLKRIDGDADLGKLQREIWAMCRTEHIQLARIRAALDWMKSLISDASGDRQCT